MLLNNREKNRLEQELSSVSARHQRVNKELEVAEAKIIQQESDSRQDKATIRNLQQQIKRYQNDESINMMKNQHDSSEKSSKESDPIDLLLLLE